MQYQSKTTLWQLTEGQRLRYGAAIAAMGFSNLFVFAVPLVSRLALDHVVGADEPSPIAAWFLDGASLWVGEETRNLLFVAATAIAVLTAIAGVFLYLRSRWASVASEAIVRALRNRLYIHLNRLPCAYHDRADTGDLVQRCTSDVETVRVFLSTQVVEIGRAVLLLATVLPILYWLDPTMTWISVSVFPVIIAFAIYFFRRVKVLFKEMDEAEGAMTTVLQENLTGIRVVRAFARQDFEAEKFGVKNRAYRDRNYRLIKLLASYWAVSDLLCFGQIGLVLGFGAHYLLAGDMSVGTLYAFLTFVSLVIWPVRHMGRVLTDSGKAIVSLGRLREILASEEESYGDNSEESPARAARGEVEVRDLNFSFGDEPVLQGISLHVPAGKTLALLGPPGSGKSTLIQLMLRLYDYDDGEILIDGVEIRSLPREEVRDGIAAVLQEPFLYSRSVRSNVGLGKGNASDEQVFGAARAACVHDAIEGFEKGYDTLVGERGVTLSGGQRQRVALARALLKESPILVLDDSLSAVDTDTETQILEALRQREGQATTFIIAHRLSSVMHADEILVFEQGRIVQRGTHESLAREPGPYQRLWQIQGALENEIVQDLQSARRD